MVPETIFIVKFNTRLPKKRENYTLVPVTSNRVARLSIPIAHYIDLINTFVTRCYLMVSKTIFIIQFNSCLFVVLTKIHFVYRVYIT